MRKIIFWTHLTFGVTAGLVVLIMSVTGVLLMYERQMIEWADRGYRSAANGNRLPPENLLRTIASQTGAMPDALTLRAAAEAPAEVNIGIRVVFADAYSGQVLGDGSAGIRRFFRVVTDWHRWLAMPGAYRPLGRSLTGVANLLFLGLAVSGMYIWLPRKWGWANVRAVLWFRRGLSGKARDFNWHNAIGIWSAIPLIFVIMGAAVISFPWATNLVYRVAGNEPPPPVARPAGPPGDRKGPPGDRPRGGTPDLRGLDRAWQQAEASVPNWRTITCRAAGGNRISLAIAASHRGRVDQRSTLIVDRATGETLEHETFASYNRGRRWRLWLRFIHTGEALGVVGQTIAGVVSAGGAVLVWTGLTLAWRRFRGWKVRQGARQQELEVLSQR
jgi:uncharacterized iron-regulated membrane protein